MVMNVASCISLILNALGPVGFPDSFSALEFLTTLFTSISIEFFLIQVMNRSWMLPVNYEVWNKFQWVLFIITSLLYLSITILTIPTSQTSVVYFEEDFQYVAGTAGFLALFIDISNSVFVIVKVTREKYYMDRDGHYFEFVKRRLPILIINITLGVFVLLFLFLGFQNSYDVANLFVALINFTSIYYYADLKDLVYKNFSSQDRSKPVAQVAAQPESSAVFTMSGEIVPEDNL